MDCCAVVRTCCTSAFGAGSTILAFGCSIAWSDSTQMVRLKHLNGTCAFHRQHGLHQRCQTRNISCPSAGGKHYAVVGAGLAGLATAYHLLKQSEAGQAVHVTVVDAVGIGAGGSGAAAGLLHPYTPKGKLLWRAQEALAAALDLLAVAEAAAAAAAKDASKETAAVDVGCNAGPSSRIAWRTGMVRPAADAKQSQQYWKLFKHKQQQPLPYPQQQQQQQQLPLGPLSAAQAMLSAALVDSSMAQQLVPGLHLPALTAPGADGLPPQHPPPPAQHPPQHKASGQPHPSASWSPQQSAALHIPGGITVQPLLYMQALWEACLQEAAARGDGSRAQLHIQQLTSLHQLQDVQCNKNNYSSSSRDCNSSSISSVQQRPFDAIVVAAGAAVGSLAEIGPDSLPLSLCQGYTLDLVPPAESAGSSGRGSSTSSSSSSSGKGSTVSCGTGRSTPEADDAAGGCGVYAAAAPSLLGSTYLASQGGRLLVVGATKQHNWTTQQALAELGRTVDPRILAQQQQQHHEPQQQQRTDVQLASSCGWDTSSHTEAPAIAAEVSAAAQELLSSAAALWPAVWRWHVGGIRSGVRALPPRTPQGALPVAGRWMPASPAQQQQQQQEEEEEEDNEEEQEEGKCISSDITYRSQPHLAKQGPALPPVWLLVGLGARGFVYHAWLGKVLAAAVIHEDESLLPPELLGWKTKTSSSSAAANMA